MSPPADPRADAVLESLREGHAEGRTVVVAAHPGGETPTLGGLLRRFADLTLVHVTDGAPEDMTEAKRLGFRYREDYRAVREAELEAALTALGVSPIRRAYGLPDQETTGALALLAGKLMPELDGASVVITHAHEGGHPDHDSCAFAVQAACAKIARTGRPAPVRLDFPSYHRRGSRRIAGRFHPDEARPERTYRLTGEELSAKEAAMAKYRTQREVMAWFSEPGVERLRPAPDYDFSARPPSGDALYDLWGWRLNSHIWRERASATLRGLGLADDASRRDTIK